MRAKLLRNALSRFLRVRQRFLRRRRELSRTSLINLVYVLFPYLESLSSGVRRARRQRVRYLRSHLWRFSPERFRFLVLVFRRRRNWVPLVH